VIFKDRFLFGGGLFARCDQFGLFGSQSVERLEPGSELGELASISVRACSYWLCFGGLR
jgi:hypothetical protein